MSGIYLESFSLIVSKMLYFITLAKVLPPEFYSSKYERIIIDYPILGTKVVLLMQIGHYLIIEGPILFCRNLPASPFISNLAEVLICIYYSCIPSPLFWQSLPRYSDLSARTSGSRFYHDPCKAVLGTRADRPKVSAS